MRKLIFLMLLLLTESSFGQYKVAENYFIQKLDFQHIVHRNFIGIYRFGTFGDFYVANEEDILSFIKYDTVDKSKLILVLSTMSQDPFNIKSNSIIDNQCYKYSTTIYDIMRLDDTEIYKINGELYIIRKLKYAYLDNVDMYSSEQQLSAYKYGDDIPNGVVTVKNISAKSFFKVDYFRCFLFMMDLKPTSKDISIFVWKKRYELLQDCFVVDDSKTE